MCNLHFDTLKQITPWNKECFAGRTPKNKECLTSCTQSTPHIKSDFINPTFELSKIVNKLFFKHFLPQKFTFCHTDIKHSWNKECFAGCASTIPIWREISLITLLNGSNIVNKWFWEHFLHLQFVFCQPEKNTPWNNELFAGCSQYTSL